MDGFLSLTLVGTSLVFALVVLVYVALARTPDRVLLALAGLIDLGVLVLIVLAAIGVGEQDLASIDAVTMFGYLAAGLVILPLGFAWSLAERSRGATAVLAVAGLTQAFVILRAVQVWTS